MTKGLFQQLFIIWKLLAWPFLAEISIGQHVFSQAKSDNKCLTLIKGLQAKGIEKFKPESQNQVLLFMTKVSYCSFVFFLFFL